MRGKRQTWGSFQNWRYGLFYSLCLLLCHARSGWTQPYIYVHNHFGRDTFNGSSAVPTFSADGPVRTIQRGLNLVKPGGAVIVLPSGEPYREELVFDGKRLQGRTSDPIYLEGNGVELRGDQPVDALTWAFVGDGVYRLEEPLLTYTMLLQHDKALPRATGVYWNDLPNLAPESFGIWRGQVVFRAADRKFIHQHPLSIARLRCGLLLDRADKIVVRNLHVRGFALDGVQVRGPVTQVYFRDCRFADNGRGGVSAYSNAQVVLDNCFLESNAEADGLARAGARLRLQNCQASEKRLDADKLSAIFRAGADPRPLEPGPFVIPPDYQRGVAAATPGDAKPASKAVKSTDRDSSGETEPTVPDQPREKPTKKGFFD